MSADFLLQILEVIMTKAVSVRLNTFKFGADEPEVLRNINLDIERGEFVLLRGASSSGKSVLLKLMAGIVQKNEGAEFSGTVEHFGEDISQKRLCELCDNAGFMMQEPQNQMLMQKVSREIAFGPENKRIPYEDIRCSVVANAKYLGIENLLDRNTNRLSGGQAQRVVLAGILAMDCSVLFLDQPAAELDPEGAKELYAYLGKLNSEKNVTVIMVPDKLKYELEYATRVITMENGSVVLDEKNGFEKYGIKEFEPLVLADIYDEEILSVSNLNFTYKNGVNALSNINFSVNKGEFVSITGKNGSGKSTLLKLTEGLLSPDSGNIKLFGTRAEKKNYSLIRQRLGYIMQDPDFQIFNSTVYDEVAFSLRAGKKADEEIKAKTEEVLRFVDLWEYRSRHPQTLSRAQRQMLAIASTLVNDAELIIADEPTSGLDAEHAVNVAQKLYNLTLQGKTVIMVTHDEEIAEHFSTKVIRLNGGEIEFIRKRSFEA